MIGLSLKTQTSFYAIFKDNETKVEYEFRILVAPNKASETFDKLNALMFKLDKAFDKNPELDDNHPVLQQFKKAKFKINL